MVESLIMQTTNSKLNSALLLALLPATVLHDYKLQRYGVYCIFNSPISLIHSIMKTFLSSLHEITDTIFYFEIINDLEAVLRIYETEEFQFSLEVLFKSSDGDEY